MLLTLNAYVPAYVPACLPAWRRQWRSSSSLKMTTSSDLSFVEWRNGADIALWAVANGVEAVERARQEPPDLALLDLVLPRPGPDGLTLGRELAREFPGVRTVVMSAYGTLLKRLAQAHGMASEFIEKPFTLQQFADLVRRVLGSSRSEHEMRHDTSFESRTADPPVFDGMIGDSLPMRRVFEQIQRFAPLQRPVLILGETGTGKELIAHSLHRRSGRPGPFVVANCAAVAATLFESQFFGHERGAFTDARDARAGYFEKADGGTLFLDEVGELPAELQPKLLRVLEDKNVERVGGRPTAIDVRVLAATNANLQSLVRRGAFRADLLYRLDALSIHVPPVRDRGADIARLVEYFLGNARTESRRPQLALSEPARQALVRYDWPGNVRQIRNVIDHATAGAHGDAVLTVDLPLMSANSAGANRRCSGRTRRCRLRGRWPWRRRRALRSWMH